MRQETWDRLKHEGPTIFTASFVAILSSWFFQNQPNELFSKQVLDALVSSLILVAIAMGAVYLVIWIFYKLDE